MVDLSCGTALGGDLSWGTALGHAAVRTALGDRSVTGGQPWVIQLSWGTALGNTAVMRDCPWW